MGETRVDLLHLLEDLRDAYPGALEETILTEMVANSLDSGAAQISLAVDPVEPALSVVDNGCGMERRELARYHDLAASAKARGRGIGFAGVGIKLGLLVSEEVLTETRRGKTHIATRWHLASRHRAPWKWTPPPGLVIERGTAVRLKLQNALSPLLDEGFLEGTLRRQYQALLDPTFDEILAPHYSHGVRFEVNGRVLERHGRQAAEVARLEIRLARKRKPTAVGYLVRESLPMEEEQRGLAISTLGKVIRRGWDWLGIIPSAPDRVGGLIEAPALAASLTLNKGDFIRVGLRGGVYLSYRKAVQEAVSGQLATWGETRDPTETARRRQVRPWERDLQHVLIDLADEFPLLATLVERRTGGQKRLPIGNAGQGRNAYGVVMGSVSPTVEEVEPATDVAEPTREQEGEEHEMAEPESSSERESRLNGVVLPGGMRGPRRPAHYGLGIRYEHRPGDPELGRLVESTVLVNEAHPAYRRAVASRSEGYHIALTVGLALAPLAEPAKEHAFVTAFLTRWGETIDRQGNQPRRRR